MRNILLIFLVLWGATLAAQSGELVGTFSVVSATGSDPSPTVIGDFNSTVGFLPGAVDTGDILVVRQVFAGNNRRKLYRITGVSGNSPLTLNLSLVVGTTGGPFPAGTHGICRPTEHGYLLDIPNVSQEIESYIANYNTKRFEDADVDTTIIRDDSIFVVLNDGTEYFAGPSAANGVTDSYQVGDSIFIVVGGADSIFTGIAYSNPEIDTIFNDGTNYYLVTFAGDTIEIGAVAQVVANGLHPTNPPAYLVHIDTLGTDTIYFDNNGTWTVFNVGGTSIGAPVFTALNDAMSTFHPTGVPPVGALIWNPFLGNWNRKFGVTNIAPISLPDGRQVRAGNRHFQFTTLNSWNLNLRSAATLGFQAGVNGTIAAPLNLSTQERGSERLIVLNNTTGNPRTATFTSTLYRDPTGVQSLTSFTVQENTDLTLSFTIDANDGEVIMRLNSLPAAAAATTVFQNQVNGLDLTKVGDTVRVAPNITELTYAAVAAADSILIWDSSCNCHRRTSIAEVVALASAGTTTVTDQANGLDITLTGSDITIAPDWNEVATSTAASGDILLVYDVSIPGYRGMTAGSIAATATPAPDATKVTKGGDTDGAPLRIGTNDNFDLAFEVNNIQRARITTGGVFDFEQLGLDDIDYANIDSSYIINPRIAALAADYSTYTTSGTLTRRLAHYVDGSSNVTMTVNSALPDRSVFFIKNQDPAFLVSVFVPGGMSLAGGNWIPPGYTAWFQRRGTVVERLDQVAAEVTGRQVMSTNVNGVFTTPHPFGAGANVKYANVQVRNEVNPYVFTIKSWDPNQITWQCWNPTTGLAQQLVNSEFTWIIKG